LNLDQIGWDASLALADCSSRTTSHYSSTGVTMRSSTAIVGTRLTGSNGVSIAYMWLDKAHPDFKIMRLEIITGKVEEDSLSGNIR